MNTARLVVERWLRRGSFTRKVSSYRKPTKLSP